MTLAGNVDLFEGGKAVRQGDSLSSYLFVLSMEVISQLLHQAAARVALKFHPECNRIGLTDLAFADDLMVFTDGSLSSL